MMLSHKYWANQKSVKETSQSETSTYILATEQDSERVTDCITSQTDFIGGVDCLQRRIWLNGLDMAIFLPRQSKAKSPFT